MNNISNRPTLQEFIDVPIESWTREKLIAIYEEFGLTVNRTSTSSTKRQLISKIKNYLIEQDSINRHSRQNTEARTDPSENNFPELNGMTLQRFRSIRIAEEPELESTHSETISEEDTNDISSITSSEADINDIKQFTSNQCKNEDLIMGEPYTVDTNDDVFIMYIQKQNSNNFNDTGICVSKTEIKEYLKSDLTEDNPKVLMTLWTGKDLDTTGHYGKPSGRIIVKMPPFNTFVTLGSLEQMLKNDYNKEWFLYPLYNGKRRRIGNLQGSYGSSQNHGQIPGSVIYKAYNKKQILKGFEIKEEYSDYPLFIYDNFRPLQQILNNDDLSIKQLSHGLIQSLIN